YSDAELARAKVLVDGILNPVDYERVRDELRRRRRQRWRERRPLLLKVVGGVLLVGAIAGLLTLRFLFLAPARVLFPMTLLPLIVWAVAGVLLILGRSVGVTLGIIALSLQLLSFAAAGIDYSFSPLLGARLVWTD